MSGTLELRLSTLHKGKMTVCCKRVAWKRSYNCLVLNFLVDVTWKQLRMLTREIILKG